MLANGAKVIADFMKACMISAVISVISGGGVRDFSRGGPAPWSHGPAAFWGGNNPMDQQHGKKNMQLYHVSLVDILIKIPRTYRVS